MLCLVFQLAYSYIQRIDVNWPTSYYDADAVKCLFSKLRGKLQKKQDWPISIVAVNTRGDGRPPFYFPPLNSNAEHVLNNPPSNPIQNPSTIDLTTPNLNHATTSYQAPPHHQNLNTNHQAFPLSQNRNANKSQTFPPFRSVNVNNPQASSFMYQTPAQDTQNPPKRSIFTSKSHFIPIHTEPHLHYIAYSELDQYEEKEKEWRAKEEMTE
uniref:Uncharacterized protein n=1 Tax=Solanum tuberosum TaxID=4113 RepID=M1DCQ5_SOLTU